MLSKLIRSLVVMGGTQMVSRDKALAGRATKMPVDATHYVLKTPMQEPFPPGTKKIILANGCFWGSEKGMWRLPPAGGIVSTAVGYAAGYTPNPTYEEVCSGGTGHTEAVQVVYDPSKISLVDILRWFWQSHDPTQVNRQGNDAGTQYRSGAYYFDEEQKALVDASKAAYEKAMQAKGFPKIATEIGAASDYSTPFYYAEPYHQQYLAKPGARPYCSAEPRGVELPPFEEWVRAAPQRCYRTSAGRRDAHALTSHPLPHPAIAPRARACSARPSCARSTRPSCPRPSGRSTRPPRTA
jgi:peptide-methionine (S)-S-oxide reductase